MSKHLAILLLILSCNQSKEEKNEETIENPKPEVAQVSVFNLEQANRLEQLPLYNH
jgi:hypothetical protein